MKPEDMEAVFAAPAGKGGAEDAPPDDMSEPDDDSESEAALDSTIDEIFDSEDPVARREAFKRAIHLCKEEY